MDEYVGWWVNGWGELDGDAGRHLYGRGNGYGDGFGNGQGRGFERGYQGGYGSGNGYGIDSQDYCYKGLN